ncbi:MAG: arginine--tRNA ligase [Desulfatibacillaceae bacterium]|nr:arginine--tRNA ligase [Desulfatibacillaceae bacterium]
MKKEIIGILREAIDRACQQGLLPQADYPEPSLEEPKIEQHGDFATNWAMVCAKAARMAPAKIARIIQESVGDRPGVIEKIEVAGPGFLNFFVRREAWNSVLVEVLEKGADFGRSNLGAGQKVQVEFVSANPTGPLHVGHGRGAAVGDSLANVLAATGHAVQREYYINDSGRQIRTLGLSVYLRAKELGGMAVDFPQDAYQGDYIKDLAGQAMQKQPGLLEMGEDKAIAFCAHFAADAILAGIRKDLEDFGVSYECWFSEQSLYDSGAVEDALAFFKEKGQIYQKDGAFWFATEKYGDEKDRVVVRANGLTTYFASDIAYHKNKFDRGFERIIDIWGADHHGYVNRIFAAVQALGRQKESFTALLVTLVNLLRGGQPLAMSTRSGEFVTLKEVVDEVGKDAARFLFLTRHHDSPLDFDLELAKEKSNDNPVFYVQYVYARICSIEKKAAQEGLIIVSPPEKALLTEVEEVRLLKSLARYPQVLESAARLLEPHRITFHLLELAALFHAYYNKHRVVGEEKELSYARLALVLAVRQVIKNGLGILCVSSPESM